MNRETRIAPEWLDVLARMAGWGMLLVFWVSMCSHACGCIPTMLRNRDSELMYEQSLGYRGPDSFERYSPPSVTQTTPWGIRYAGKVDQVRLDTVAKKTLECLHAEQRRFDFTVLVPDDWTLSCDGTQEVLPVRSYSALGDCGKGLTGPCPCRWRDGVHGPAENPTLISPPSLLLLPRAIAVWVRGGDYYLKWDYNPWADPETAPCLGPWSSPLSVELAEPDWTVVRK